MPNSLKCRLKGLVRKGLLSEKDLSRIYTDNDVEQILEMIQLRLVIRANEHLDGDYYVRVADINEVIVEKIAELKGENNEI